MFRKATKKDIKLRIALSGISGSGKTWTSLLIASYLGKRIGLIDSENGSSERYADQFSFDVSILKNYKPDSYAKEIKAAQDCYDVLIIDSLSHAWIAELDYVRSQKNSYTAWSSVRPKERELLAAIVECKCHLIATMREKTDYVLEENEKGKQVPRRIGTSPIQASGIEYEFDLWGKLDLQNNLKIEKSRYSRISGKTFSKPGAEFSTLLLGWIYPWKLWRNDQDALNWAAGILPDMKIDEIQKEYINLQPENGQKFPTWVNYVHNLDKF